MTSINTTFVSPMIQQSQAGFDRAAENITSGKRIQSAADDAAGLAIASRFSADIAGFDQAMRNAGDGISLAQTAEGGLSSINNNLQRIRELSLQASNGTLNDSDRSALNREASQLRDEINRVVETTSFNGIPLLSKDGEINLQAGADAGQTIGVQTRDLSGVLSDSGLAELDISSVEGAQAALAGVDQVLGETLNLSSDYGATINRLGSALDNLQGQSISARETRSRIEDADLAKEAAALVQNKILNQASIAVQGQANQQASLVLRLLS